MKLERWNPSVKAAVVLISVILLSFQFYVSLNLAVFCLCLVLVLFFSDARPGQVITILIPAFTAAFGLFMMGLYYSRGSSITDVEMEGISAVP